MNNKSDYSLLGDRLLGEISQNFSKTEVFRKVANLYSDNEEHANRIFYYLSQNYFCPSTPILANIHHDNIGFKGLPISCFLTEVNAKSIEDIFSESLNLSKNGGGIGTLWNNLPSLYDEGMNYRNSFGVLPFIQIQGKLVRLAAGFARKVGSLCAYLHISHADIINFIRMRKNAQGIDSEVAIPRYIHHAVVISDDFMNSVINNKQWHLHDKKGNIVHRVSARDLWMEIITIRSETGEPYIMFEDNANKGIAKHHKKLGLKIKMSNLCTEITLPTGLDHKNIERTAVCCLSSINLIHYTSWKEIPDFFNDIARFMDNILTYFVHEAPKRKVGDIFSYATTFGITTEMRKNEEQSYKDAFTYNHPIAKAAYSAFVSRDIGIGLCGWSSLLQSLNIPFESEEAIRLNKEISQCIKNGLDTASVNLANERGACQDAAECGIMERFSYKTAIAPTSQIASIMGVSKSIEVDDSVYLSKTQNGFHLIKNQLLKEYLSLKGLDNSETWHNIASKGLDTIVPKDVYEVFKGPYDINPLSMVNQVADRYIDQSQSFTLFFKSPIDMNQLIKAHMESWKLGIKTMYYLRSTPKINPFDSLNLDDSDKMTEEGCTVCE